MTISRQEYDQQPLAIRHGALLLWGKLMSSQWEGNIFHQLYRFNDFWVETCYDADQQRVTWINSFPDKYE